MPESATPHGKKKIAPYLLGTILAAFHVGLFLLVTAIVATSKSSDAGMLFGVFLGLDAPIARFAPGISWILVFGTLWWFCLGHLGQSIFRWRKKGGPLHIAIALTGLGLLYFSPNLRLVGKPAWEREYIRGAQAAESGNLAAGISHLKEAIQLAGPESEHTIWLYEYLRNLYLSTKEYGPAIDAARSRVELALKWNARQSSDWQQQSNSTVLNSYNSLATACRLAGRKQEEKSALQEAMRWNRIVSSGDSIQEANCLSELAQLAWDDGNRAEAINLLEKAQRMAAKFEPVGSFTMTYIAERLTEWREEP